MKLRRLQELDLANAATTNKEHQRKILEGVIEGFGPWSYDPAKQANFCVFNPDTALGLPVEKAPLEQILSSVRRQCKNSKQAASCVEVVRLLDTWVCQNVSRSVERNIPSISLSSMGVVNYSLNLVALCDGTPTFIFLDHRRQGGLSVEGRRFALSMMDRQIRKVFTQFADADLRLLQFVQRGKSPRKILETKVSDVHLFSIEQLDKMIDNTFQTWTELHEERFGRRFKEG